MSLRYYGHSRDRLLLFLSIFYSMKKTFTLGAVSGMATLMLAVPIFAQISAAEETDGSTPAFGKHFMMREQRSLTQKDVQNLVEKDDTFLANIDAFVAIQKSATEARRDALAAAASIEDDTGRQDAVRVARETYRAAIEEALEANPDLKPTMHMGFGKGSHGGFGGGERGRRQNPTDLAEKLGMTTDELQTALDAGKTIPEIAEEQGVALPKPPFEGGKRGRMPFGR